MFVEGSDLMFVDIPITMVKITQRRIFGHPPTLSMYIQSHFSRWNYSTNMCYSTLFRNKPKYLKHISRMKMVLSNFKI